MNVNLTYFLSCQDYKNNMKCVLTLSAYQQLITHAVGASDLFHSTVVFQMPEGRMPRLLVSDLQ